MSHSNREAVRKYRQTKKGKLANKSAAVRFRKNNPDYMRRWQLKNLYNITIEDYDELFEQQGGCCLICSKHQSEQSQRLNVDHDHNSNEIRGLLCWSCNHKLGWFENNSEAILNYLGGTP